MAPKPIEKNALFYGDNLPILREHIQDESIDLIYLDPPFNSNRSYNVLFKDESGQESEAQMAAFDDTWHWGRDASRTYYEIVHDAPNRIAEMIGSLHGFIGENQMMAYLVMMTTRLVELHRVLKPTGSLYLHCDPTASHYLKIILDTIFGVQNFQNEIVWKRTSSHSDAKKYPKITDTLLFCSKSSNFTWNKSFGEYDGNYLTTHYRSQDGEDRKFQYGDLVKPKGSIGYFYTLLGCLPPPNGWRMPESRANQWLSEGRIEIPPTGKVPRFKRYLDEMKGTVIPNLWTDIPPINSQAKDALGYPTQKPIELLERIIRISSNPGDLVLDPFCGCGTAIIAAQKLGRRWVGIDITYLAISLQKYRLKDAFNIDPGIDYDVIGEPVDLISAKQLATDNRYQFQWWACGLVRAMPLGGEAGGKTGKKGRDLGIDGKINFIDDAKGTPKSVLVQVKSGHVKSGDIRDLHGTVDRENAAIGVLITPEEPTREMAREAMSAGYYTSELWQQDFPRIQILTVEQLLIGERVQMPPAHGTFKKAEKVKKEEGSQAELDI